MQAVSTEEAALRATCTPEEWGESLIRRRHELDVLELLWSRDAVRFSATDHYDVDGFNSPYDWIRVNCHMNSGQVLDRIAVAEQVEAMPESLQAMLSGEIGFQHLVVMAKTADALQGSKTARPFDETMVLDKARENTPGRLHHVCLHLRHALDAQAYAEEEQEVVELRSLEIKSGGEGMASVTGYLDSAGAAVLRKALEPLARRAGKEDKRERKQRLADALVELATGGKPAQIQVTASIETLMGLAGAPAGEMEFSLPISARMVERMACDCSVVRVLLAADSSVIDVGRATQKVSPAMRRALVARDGGCRWPGCNRKAYFSDAHHLFYWTKGGKTKLDNLVLLCYHHHRRVHEGGWQLIKCDDGRLMTIAPPMKFRSWGRGPD
jgi:Domain of unknown function (DUF222)/HNH endonuclease